MASAAVVDAGAAGHFAEAMREQTTSSPAVIPALGNAGLAGIPERPPGAGGTPRTWWMLTPPSSKPTADAGHVEAPHPGPGLADERDGPVPVGLEVGHPARSVWA